MKENFKIALSFIVLLFWGYSTKSAIVTAVDTGGEWSESTTWNGGTIPQYGDLVVIPNDVTVTITNQELIYGGFISVNGTLSLIYSEGEIFGSTRLLMDEISNITLSFSGKIESISNAPSLNFNYIRFGDGEFLGIANGQVLQGPETLEYQEPSVLPVVLLDFSAVSIGSNIKVAWITASEVNNDYFTIQRSSDGVTWNSLGLVEGVGNTSEQTDYTFYDKTPIVGKAFYRLLQTDVDGTVKSYRPVSIIYEMDLPYSFYPNPADDEINFIFKEDTPTVIIRNIKGEQVFEGKSTENLGLNVITEDLPAGIYIVEINLASQKFSGKIIIRH